MLARKVMYYFMNENMLNERIEKIGNEMKLEADFNKRMKQLEKVSDILAVTIYKNRDNKEVMKFTKDELQRLSEKC